MQAHLSARIRSILRAAPDGLTIRDICAEMDGNYDVVRKSINKMPDVYIDRWTKEPSTRGKYAAVWCAVIPPENCPPPNRHD